ncbi:Dyp-type peroxidase [Streptomyces albidoflavus]|nr:Dyp-type peroxidase [Streptomyces albidoflavus]
MDAPLSAAAGFLVLVVKDGEEAAATVRSVVAGTDDLIKDITIRANGAMFTCNVGISHHGWPRLTEKPLPKELRPFREIKGEKHTAVATPGDLLYHLRAASPDLIVEFEKILLEAFGDSVTAVDDVTGFRYFDGRDLLEFADGTANPDGAALPAATLVGDEDPAYAGGSYVVVQKYLHDLSAWRAQTTGTQEEIIGRTKFDNVENHADLAAGAPMENTSNGALWSLRGSPSGVTSAQAVSFSAATAGLSKDPYQYFGRSFASGR